MLITKADGTQEEFKPNKLAESLEKAGAEKPEIDAIVHEIESTITPGERTQDIYRKAFELLVESEKPIAAKYSLRRAVFGLGPTGFPFEDFLGKLFESEGFTIQKRILVEGKCATHEIDIAAYREDHSFVAEAKFHMRPGIKSDLQVTLYSYARFLDLQSRPSCAEDTCGIKDLLVITNTKFTHAAVKYAGCVGINLLSWHYPSGEGLQDKIERSGLYPITVLTGLSRSNKQELLENGIILCHELIERQNSVPFLNLSKGKMAGVLDEAGQLCGSN